MNPEIDMTKVKAAVRKYGLTDRPAPRPRGSLFNIPEDSARRKVVKSIGNPCLAGFCHPHFGNGG